MDVEPVGLAASARKPPPRGQRLSQPDRQNPDTRFRPSLMLLREVARELGYQPPEDQLAPLNEQILDRLFQLSPQIITSPALPRRYRSIARRVLRKHLRP